ncbi:MAG: helix-turn-helix domain-containing protein, partial [Chryseolinea sp.]
MKLKYLQREKNAAFHLIINEAASAKPQDCREKQNDLLTIAWNTGDVQKVIVDSIEYDFPSNSILPLVVNQSFQFTAPESIVAWQFNRDFYCIVNHDEDVSCVGFLFYGSSKTMFISLDEKDQRKIKLLFEVFKDEFEQTDNIQGEMLRMLLVRLIITITRLAKQQYFHFQISDDDSKFNLFRQFNLSVELHYKREHEVQFYAAQLNKSPKTIANVFAIYGRKSPSQIIYDRIALEAKRLFLYTDKTAKEVYGDLGF